MVNVNNLNALNEAKQKYDFVGEVKFIKDQRCRQNNNLHNFFYCSAISCVIDHYAKDGGPGEVCHSCSFYYDPLQQ